MKKIILFFLSLCITGQALLSQTALFKPGPATGVDALLLHSNTCTGWETTNAGAHPENNAMAWTYNAQNCGFGRHRSLIQFNDLNTLPAGAIITYAELRLFGLPSSGSYGNSQYPGSPYTGFGPNNGWVRRVTTPWAEMGVTWNTQPSTTTTDQAATPVSTSQWNFNIAVNVTNQVIAMMAPGQNNGFMLMLDNENYYRSVMFASSDHANSNLWPELFVQYTVPCNADFSWCVSANTPNVYKFSADNVRPGYTYTWTFGDGTTATGSSVTHGYAAGSYEVCLEAYNAQTGDRCSKCAKICVAEGTQTQCVAYFSATVSGSIGSFSFIPNGSVVTSYYWEFGDGSATFGGPNVNHNYIAAGLYHVCLTVTYENGCVARFCKKVVINTGGPIDDLKTAAPPSFTLPAGDRIGDIKPVGNIRVSPNPVNAGSITVSINAAVNGIYRYTISGAQGPLITGAKNVQKGVQNIELDVSRLKPGKYWIGFSNNKQESRTSFIKL